MVIIYQITNVYHITSSIIVINMISWFRTNVPNVKILHWFLIE